MTDEMDEIWALYADDGAQALDAMEVAVAALAADPGSDAAPDHIAALFRAVHTYKGNSRVLGLAVVEGAAHLAEDLIGLVRDEGAPFTPRMAEVLVLAADRFRAMLEETARTRSDVAPTVTAELMAALQEAIAAARGGPAPTGGDRLPDTPAAEGPAAETGGETGAEKGAETGASAALPPPAPVPNAAPNAPAAPPQRGLLADPGYRRIFAEMVDEALSVLRGAADALPDETGQKRLRALLHAARQMRAPDWVSTLEGAGGAPASAIVAKLERLAARDLAPDPPGDGALAPAAEAMPVAAPPAVSDTRQSTATPTAPEPPDDTGDATGARLRRALVEVAGPLEALVAAAPDGPAPHAIRAAVLDALRPLIQPDVTPRAARALAALEAAPPDRLPAAALVLMRELAIVEAGTGPAGAEEGPTRALRRHAARALPDVLNDLRSATLAPDSPEHSTRLAGRLRALAEACRHHGLDPAADLALAVGDGLARAPAGAQGHALLRRMAVGLAEALAETTPSPDGGPDSPVPDMPMLQTLDEMRSHLAHGADGADRLEAMEQSLGLPADFRRVLSPSALAAALAALDRGEGFVILRADINDDDRLAGDFMDLIGRDGLRPITNATVFEGGRTVFDFLVATAQPVERVRAALDLLDAGRDRLHLRHVLSPDPATPRRDPLFDPAPAEAVAVADDATEAALLAAVGEATAAGANLRGVLARLAEAETAADLSATIADRLAARGLPAEEAEAIARDVAARTAEQLTDRLALTLAAADALAGALDEAQQQAIALRQRPAAPMLRPLTLFAQSEAAVRGLPLRLQVQGAETSIDAASVPTLRSCLRACLSRLIAGHPGPEIPMRLSIRQSGHQILARIEADGITRAQAMAAADHGGDLPAGAEMAVTDLGGGLRVDITLPRSMAAIEGLVVEAGGVTWVVPVECVTRVMEWTETDLRAISAEGGLRLIDTGAAGLFRLTPLPGTPALPRPGLCLLVTGTDSATPPAADEARGIAAHRPGGRAQAAAGGLALPVDRLLGQQAVLLRPLEGVLARSRHLAGVAILAGGEVGVVLAPDRLVPQVLRNRSAA